MQLSIVVPLKIIIIRGLLRFAPPLLVKCDDSVLKSVVNDLKLYEIELPRYESQASNLEG